MLRVERGFTWPEPPDPFGYPEVELNYYFDFCGTPRWGCAFEYLLCIGPVCHGPSPERIHTTETDTKDTVLITATSQLTSSVYAEVLNVVITPWYPFAVGTEKIYLPLVRISQNSFSVLPGNE